MKTATIKKTIAIIAAIMLALMFLAPIVTTGVKKSMLIPSDMSSLFDDASIDVFAVTCSQMYVFIHTLSMFPIPLIAFKIVLISLIMFGLFVGFAGAAYFGFRTKIKAMVSSLFGIISSVVFLITVLACSLAYSKFIGINGEPFKIKFGWGMYLMLSAALAIIILSIIQLVKGETSDSEPPVSFPLPPPPPPLPPRGDTSYDHAQIVGIAGMFKDAKFDVSDGTPVKFGRDASVCQIVFDQFAAAISRVHCTITYIPSSNRYLVRDNSKNGVFIDSPTNKMSPGTEQILQRGTVIYLGSNKNAFRLD